MTKKELVIVEGEAVTANAITDQQMDRTLKVTQRTMKQRLQQELKKLAAVHKEKKKECNLTLKVFRDKMNTEAQTEVYTQGNFGIYDLFDAVNSFAGEGVFETIEDMVSDLEIHGAGQSVPHPDSMVDQCGCIIYYVHLDVDVDSNSYGRTLRKAIGVGLTGETNKLFEAFKAAHAIMAEAAEACHTCETKLRGVDTIVEQMETKLLTEELRRTPEGEKFLQSVVGSMEEFLSDGKHINLIEGVKK